MIKRLLKSIRQKPKSSRDNIAFSLAAIFSGLILAVWLYNAPTRHMAIEEKYKSTEEKNTSSSFSSFFDNFTDQMAGVLDSAKVQDKPSSQEEAADEVFQIKVDPMTVEGRASTSDMYTWPTETNESGESTSSQSSAGVPAETGREIRIITTERSTTTAN